MFNPSINNFGQQSYTTYSNNSNIVLVTSLEEAVLKTVRPGSDMVYFNQNGGTFYRVKVEFDGRKTYQEFTYSLPEPVVNPTPVSREEFQEVIGRLKTLEEKLNREDVDTK